MIIDPSQALAFLVAAVAVTIAPGPDNLMVLSLGLSKGRKEGMAFGAGAGMGCLSHTLLVVLGVSAAIAASPAALTLLRVCGSFYLIWLGIGALRSASTLSIRQNSVKTEKLWSLFVKGLLANAINPKVILFFLAFLPRFINESRGYVGLQAAQLGLIFTVETVILFSALGYFSGAVGRWLNRYPNSGVWLDRFSGFVFIVLGLSLLVDLVVSLLS